MWDSYIVVLQFLLGAEDGLSIGTLVEAIRKASRREIPALMAGWLDRLDERGRWALLKLVTGGLRVEDQALGKFDLALNYGNNRVDSTDRDAINPSWGTASPSTGGVWITESTRRPDIVLVLSQNNLRKSHALSSIAR